MELEDGDDLFFNGEQSNELQQHSEPALIGENNEVVEAPLVELEEDTATVTKKKRTINRGPKLDSKRLLGPRGLPALQSYFEDFSFKGKGHEAEDLNLMMEKLEHWAHRLYPKYTFDDCIEKIEALGHKKEVQTCLKRVRMGMEIIDENLQSTIITEDGPAVEEDNSEEGMMALFNDSGVEGPHISNANLTMEPEDFNTSILPLV